MWRTSRVHPIRLRCHHGIVPTGRVVGHRSFVTSRKARLIREPQREHHVDVRCGGRDEQRTKLRRTRRWVAARPVRRVSPPTVGFPPWSGTAPRCRPCPAPSSEIAVAVSTNSPAPQRRPRPVGSRCAGLINNDDAALVGLDSAAGRFRTAVRGRARSQRVPGRR